MANPKSKEPEPTPPAYVITGSQDATRLNDAGRIEEVKVITYRTAFGDTGRITISKDEFTAENAQRLIEIEVTELLKLRGG